MWATMIHRLWTEGAPRKGRSELSTARPQDDPRCAQLRPASPHLCPLFGNEMRSVPRKSERHHTKEVGCPGENVGISGDGAGENHVCPVYRVCTTSGRPQTALVIHGRRPQARWIKNAAPPAPEPLIHGIHSPYYYDYT